VSGRFAVTYRWARRIAIAIIGGTVLLAGIAMVVLPGPAFIVIPVGLGILGLEFAWARTWLKRLKARSEQVLNSVRRNGNSKSGDPP